MGWRTVVITKSAKLDYQLGSVVIRQDETLKILLDEINILIIESTAVSLTAALISELSKKKIKVIFCDEKRNPSSEIVPYYGAHDTSAKVRNQIIWDDYIKKAAWTSIVREKITMQAELLGNVGLDAGNKLLQYANEVEFGDSTNREGHAAKVYFNALFGNSFSRNSDSSINAALNYGYAILLSAINREIVANGYITQIGLFHDNMFNQFNLGSDLLEPFRPLVDKRVLMLNPEKFEKAERLYIVDVLNDEVYVSKRRETVSNAIKIYVKSVLDAVSVSDLSLIRFYRNEL